MYAQIGRKITMGHQSTRIKVHFCQVWGLNKRRLFRYVFFKKNVSFQIFQLSTIFLIFSDNRIVFSEKFYVGFICLDIFLSHFLVFCMIFKKLVQKIWGKTLKFHGSHHIANIGLKLGKSLYFIITNTSAKSQLNRNTPSEDDCTFCVKLPL